MHACMHMTLWLQVTGQEENVNNGDYWRISIFEILANSFYGLRPITLAFNGQLFRPEPRAVFLTGISIGQRAVGRKLTCLGHFPRMIQWKRTPTISMTMLWKSYTKHSLHCNMGGEATSPTVSLFVDIYHTGEMIEIAAENFYVPLHYIVINHSFSKVESSYHTIIPKFKKLSSILHLQRLSHKQSNIVLWNN